MVLLGSSRLLLKKGLSESLAGRFELLPMGHWSYQEMHEAFGWDMNQYVYFGGYPGSASYLPDEKRWRKYVRDAIVAPAIERDVLQTTYIYKPSLMVVGQNLFHALAALCQLGITIGEPGTGFLDDTVFYT